MSFDPSDDDVVGRPCFMGDPTAPVEFPSESLMEVVGKLRDLCQASGISASMTFFQEMGDSAKIGIFSWQKEGGSEKIRDRITLLGQLSQVGSVQVVGTVGTDLFDGDDGSDDDDDTTEGGEG